MLNPYCSNLLTQKIDKMQKVKQYFQLWLMLTLQVASVLHGYCGLRPKVWTL